VEPQGGTVRGKMRIYKGGKDGVFPYGRKVMRKKRATGERDVFGKTMGGGW